MSNRNGRAKPFSHKDHALALQGQVQEQQKQLEAIKEAGIRADTQRMLYAQIVSTLMLKSGLHEVVLEPDDYDAAMIHCSMRFTTQWKDRGDGTRDAVIVLVMNDEETKDMQRAAVESHRKKIAEALAKMEADDDGEKPTDGDDDNPGLRLLGSDGEPL